jgi:glucokinase-like ROK family protein
MVPANCVIIIVLRTVKGKSHVRCVYHAHVTEPTTQLASNRPGSAPGETAPGRRRGRPPLPEEILDSFVVVLEEIRLGRSGSRAELVERTGLGRAIVARRVSDLVDRGLVREELGPSTGGRPPRQLTFRADAGHVLAADLGASGVDVAVTSLDGRVLGHHGEPARIEAGPEACLDRVATLFDSLVRTTQGIPGRPWGIGISVPGPVEFRTGRPISPPIMPGWDGFPIREWLAARYQAPVWVDNDVNVMALGEWRSGVAVGHDNVVVIKIGTGIGAGIISDGRLHRGAQGSAGDVGHIQITDDPAVVCRCGNIGCLEALAGGEALGRAGEAAALSGQSPRLQAAFDLHGSVTAEDVGRAASFGDPVAVALLQAAGRQIGAVLASLVNFFNPSLIVIGGGVANSPERIMAAIRETIYRRSLPLATRDLLVRTSSLGGLAGVIGASTMVVDQLFSRESIGRWIEAGEPFGMPEVAQASAG